MSTQSSLVVVVDDSEEMREVLAMMFAREGLQVAACADANQAFELIQSERPLLVLTDLMLGASSGLELISRVRSDLAPPVPPIIACSGFVSFEKEALERGAAAFVPKPFELETLQRVVSKVLTHHRLGAKDRKQASRESQQLRAQALEASRFALARLEPNIEDWTRRAAYTTRALPEYFGFGEAFSAFLRDDRLRIRSSSNPEHWPREKPVGFSICRDMLETASPLVVPDLFSLGATFRGPGGAPLRFFAGVPILFDQVAIGVLCFVDVEPRRLDAEGFALLEALARRASSVVSETHPSVPAVWTAAGLASASGLELMLTAELSRAARAELMVGLFVWAGGAPMPRAPRARTVFAQVHEDRYALLVTRPDTPDARRELVRLVGDLSRAEQFVGGGLITLEGGGVSTLDAVTVMRTAEALLERALKGDPGSIERLMIRREHLGPLPPDTP